MDEVLSVIVVQLKKKNKFSKKNLLKKTKNIFAKKSSKFLNRNLIKS